MHLPISGPAVYENQGNTALRCSFVFKRGYETKLEFMQKVTLQRWGTVHLHSVFHMLAEAYV